ncbi:MalY/PatB family protein [Facklamia miroungae]|uniref:cysteine-S-conjugate beta-lyase n=1 Tax=Facklamia miroungae TaxID=120956 RepID=A0A1G7UD66_9LACT|nr:MalY/PatB family protein [Facklamia miroungae]NKZ30060.1 pyridoxal phosphate-dependent aminotransferase [Facklamia miroungae]SDG45288.1 cystathione beta-lyase [Facklamia miroungae]
MDFDKVKIRKGTYSTQWDYIEDRFGHPDLLPFSISDTDFQVPENVRDSLRKRLDHGIFGYTRWNHSYFKDSVRKWFSQRFQTHLENREILYSPSVMYSISKLIDMHSNINEGVIIQTPVYDAFFKTIKANQRKIVENPLNYTDGYYSIDFKDLEVKLADDENKILLLCSPHNPTGRVWTEEELSQIVSLCKKYNVYIISDEIHMDILRNGVQHKPIIKLAKDNVALVSSGSKTFNFPGLIYSYVILSNKNDIERFSLRLKEQDGVSSASILGMEATISAYNNNSQWVDELNHYLDLNIKFISEFIKENFPEMYVVPSESTYLMWIDTSNYYLSMDEIQHRLVNIGKVAIMDGSVYGGNGKNFLRLNIGCPKQKLVEGMRRFKVSLNY